MCDWLRHLLTRDCALLADANAHSNLQSQDTHHPLSHSLKQAHMCVYAKLRIAQEQHGWGKQGRKIGFLQKNACSSIGMLGCSVTRPSTGIKPLLKALSEDRKHTNCLNGKRIGVKVESFSGPLWPGRSLHLVVNKDWGTRNAVQVDFFGFA